MLEFDSKFEGGNLDKVVIVSPSEYDLYMRVDSNTNGHNQWFFFRVKSQRPMNKIRFNIMNFTKKKSLFELGMKICVCSQAERESELRNIEL